MIIKHILPIILSFAVLSGCGYKGVNKNTEEVRNVFAMDTEMTLKAYGENAVKALDDAETEIQRLDKLFRRGDSSSEIYKVNNTENTEVSEETAQVIDYALSICNETNGAFDITIAPVMDIWGFYTKRFYVPADDELNEVLQRVNYKNVCVSQNNVTVSGESQIDLGGIAKGYLSDRIMEIYKKDGISSGIVSLGGNVQTLGKKPDGSEWRVAIQNPDDDSFIGSVKISNEAVITSGAYQRFFEQNGVIYHHIINPKDGKPAYSGVKSVTIISENGTLADSLSTSLFVMGLDKGMEYWRTHNGFDVIFITDDNEIYITDGIKDIFESQNNYSVIS